MDKGDTYRDKEGDEFTVTEFFVVSDPEGAGEQFEVTLKDREGGHITVTNESSEELRTWLKGLELYNSGFSSYGSYITWSTASSSGGYTVRLSSDEL